MTEAANPALSPSAPRVDTPRLCLRGFRPDDLDAYAAMCADAEVMRHIGAGGPVGRDNAWRQMAIFIGSWALLGYGMWAIEERASGRLVGRAGFLHPPDWPDCELGWLLGREFWGRGYALEAAGAARDHGRRALGVGRLISLIRSANERSLRLAERLGAVPGERIDFLGGDTWVYVHPGR